jgi:hypothetical protein
MWSWRGLWRPQRPTCVHRNRPRGRLNRGFADGGGLQRVLDKALKGVRSSLRAWAWCGIEQMGVFSV